MRMATPIAMRKDRVGGTSPLGGLGWRSVPDWTALPLRNAIG